MNLKDSCVRSYRTRSPMFSLETLRALPKPGGCVVIAAGKRSYFFQGDQLEVLTGLATSLTELFHALPTGCKACICTESQYALLKKPLFLMLKCLLQNQPKRRLLGLGCRSCGFCKDLSLFLESRDFRSAVDLRRLAYAVSPQVLPKDLPELGKAQYHIDPFSINLLLEGDVPVYLPLLDGLRVEDRVKIFDLIREVRALEWKSLHGPISLDLADIIDQRKMLMRDVGMIGDNLLSYAIYSSVGLSNLFPLLMDDRVSEFFVDREWSLAYLDHRDYGRCNSALYVGREGMSHLLTFSRMVSGKAMDYLSPSLRSSIKTADFYVRISADAPPLSLEGTSMAVRKFFSTPMSLQELVANYTLNPEAAAYLTHRLSARKSFTIYGESGSGKTTLAVALDLLTPPAWRKISVESDVAENVTQSHLGKHQIRLLASSASKTEQERRTSILNSLLHKSPDYVFFGEVLSREDSESLFQILAAGLRCIHTIHAESAESLFDRWIFQHGVPPQSLKDLDVVVEMRKNRSEERIQRRVYRICEVVKGTNTEMPGIRDIFLWDEGAQTLKMAVGEAPLLRGIRADCGGGLVPSIESLQGQALRGL